MKKEHMLWGIKIGRARKIAKLSHLRDTPQCIVQVWHSGEFPHIIEVFSIVFKDFFFVTEEN